MEDEFKAENYWFTAKEARNAALSAPDNDVIKALHVVQAAAEDGLFCVTFPENPDAHKRRGEKAYTPERLYKAARTLEHLGYKVQACTRTTGGISHLFISWEV
jgi:hypothetical protein